VSEPKQYKIVTANDFRAVPLERLKVCLQEFQDSLEHCSMIESIARDLAAADGVTIPADACLMPSFTWIDDGKRSVEVRFEAPL
jgi:hypothetical protein